MSRLAAYVAVALAALLVIGLGIYMIRYGIGGQG